MWITLWITSATFRLRPLPKQLGQLLRGVETRIFQNLVEQKASGFADGRRRTDTQRAHNRITVERQRLGVQRRMAGQNPLHSRGELRKLPQRLFEVAAAGLAIRLGERQVGLHVVLTDLGDEAPQL